MGVDGTACAHVRRIRDDLMLMMFLNVGPWATPPLVALNDTALIRH